jgi:hopanoid biosynthesis associated radical SAM protein HpnH
LSVPLKQVARVGAYVVKQHLAGRKRYPLVLMLEPLFRCNLACSGCGKIDYPAEILNQRISVKDALEAVDECGAPVVSIAGGEPLLHKELPEIVTKILERKKFIYLCTNALLLEKKMDLYKPHPYFCWDIHLDGDREMHDRAVSQEGTYDRAVAAIREAKRRGFRVSINCTLFDGAQSERVAKFFDDVTAMGIDGIMTAMPMNARPTRRISSAGRRPSSCFGTSWLPGKAAAGSSASRRCSSTSWPAMKNTIAPHGATRRETCSDGSAPATCSAKAIPRPTRS